MVWLRRKLRHLGKAVTRIRWTAPLLVTFFAGLGKLTALPWWIPKGFHAWVVQNQFWLLVAPPVVGTGLDYLRKKLDSGHQARKSARAAAKRQDQLQELMHQLLERLRNHFIYARLRTDPPLSHRLTLYQANESQTRLEIVARSVAVTSGSKTTWRIDANDERGCEGVAGVGWWAGASFVVRDLPDVSGCVSETDIHHYAKSTFVTPEQVKEHRWKARSYGVVPIRDAKGRPWGVVILDSIEPRGTDEMILKRITYTANMLSDIITQWSCT